LQKISIYKIFFFAVHNVQPLLQAPKNFNFRSPVTISRDGVTALNETPLPYIINKTHRLCKRENVKSKGKTGMGNRGNGDKGKVKKRQ
jgi:hypothetical protein